MSPKFKAGDILQMIGNIEYWVRVVKINGDYYTLTTYLSPKSGSYISDYWEVHTKVTELHFRKLTKLDKALK